MVDLFMSEYGLASPSMALDFTPTQYILLSKAIMKRKNLELVKIAEALRVAVWSEKKDFNKWRKQMLRDVDAEEEDKWMPGKDIKLEGFRYEKK